MKTPTVVTVPNVELLHAGIEYNLSTGPTTFTPEDLRDLVMAANEDPSIPSPRLGLGHVDPRFNGPQFDGEPNFGKAVNLRLSESGMAVVADYAGVPKWLGDILPYAYPSRSIEGFWDVESQMGKKWRFVLSSCKLLGVKWPGCTVLQDLPLYYGDEIPEGVVLDDSIVEAVVMAANGNTTGGDPKMKIPFKRVTTASANLDDVRRAFYSDYIPGHQEMNYCWIQAVYTDPNEIIVEDDESGQLYRLSFSSDGMGTVNFGDPEAVRIDYVPDTTEAKKAAASHTAALLGIGRECLASWPSMSESRPDAVVTQPTKPGGVMDPKVIRTRLGLPEDATDEQVQESIRELNAAAGMPEPTPVVPAVEPPAPADVTPTTEPAPVAVAATGALPPGVVLIEEAALNEIREHGKVAASLVETHRKNERERLVTAAIGDGRVAPARKDHWLQALESDPEGYAEVLAKLQPGLIPLEERGHGHAPDAIGAEVQFEQETVTDWTRRLFPETRNLEPVAAGAGELGRRRRVVSDAHYTR